MSNPYPPNTYPWKLFDTFQKNLNIPSGGGSSGGGSDTKLTISGTLDGVNRNFVLSGTVTAANLKFFRNGELLSSPDDFTLSASTVTLAFAPGATDNLAAYGGGSTTRQVITGAVDGSNRIFTLPSAPASAVLMFFVNGELQLETSDYTLVGNTITLNVAPSLNSNVVAYA